MEWCKSKIRNLFSSRENRENIQEPRGQKRQYRYEPEITDDEDEPTQCVTYSRQTQTVTVPFTTIQPTNTTVNFLSNNLELQQQSTPKRFKIDPSRHSSARPNLSTYFPISSNTTASRISPPSSALTFSKIRRNFETHSIYRKPWPKSTPRPSVPKKIPNLRTQPWDYYTPTRPSQFLPKPFINMGLEENSRITRSSGVSPAIPGLNVQPWQFNFQALVKSKIPEEKEEMSLSPENAKITCFPGLQVIFEKINAKGKESVRINSLAMEMKTQMNASKDYTQSRRDAYVDLVRSRNKEIDLQKQTMQILKKESDMCTVLEDRIRDRLTLTNVIVLEDEKVEPELPEITEDMHRIIDSVSRYGNVNEVIAKHYNIDLTRADVKSLAPSQWLNDNVINLYLEMIAHRSKNDNYPSVYVFTTFFYPKYCKEGHSTILKRWTRKVDLFAFDLLIFPIHLGVHWCLAVADNRKKVINYYDSLGGKNHACLKNLITYLGQELEARKQIKLNKEEWTLNCVAEIPQQQNGSDCGMFTCKFAEYLSREAK